MKVLDTNNPQRDAGAKPAATFPFSALACVAFLFGGILPAAASSSNWYASEGGKVRIVTSGKPDSAGRLHGALEIALQPGWKTYWRDPGDSGVPPQISVTDSINIVDAQIAFPAPQRHDDGYGQWAGYDKPVSLPITFLLANPKQKATIEADVFLGVCDTICVPLQTRLTVDPQTAPDDLDDAAQIKAALAALPAPASPDFGIKVLPGDHETLVVEPSLPVGIKSVDFFVAGEGGYMFGPPERHEKNGKTTFSVPILDRPINAPSEGGLHYTLTGDDKAVAGLLPYP